MVMSKYLRIGGIISLLIGLGTIYAGYNMGKGKFWGTTYMPGDYTTLYVGIGWMVVGILMLIFAYLKDCNKGDELKESQDNHTSKMKVENIVANLIRFIALFFFIIGLLTFLAGFSKYTYGLVSGIGLLIVSVLLWGLSYIVQAAIIYVKKQRERQTGD